MLGIPMLGGVAIKTAIAKKIDKKARKKMQEAAPAVLKGLGGMPRLKDKKKNLKGGYREAQRKTKEKFAEFARKKANKGDEPSPVNRMTGGGYGITRMNMDRSADSMPVSMLNRFNYGSPRMSRNFMQKTESDPNFKPKK